MTQFARNYLKIRLKDKLNKFIKVNYKKCMQDNNRKYFQRKINL